eukprot:TRINITY_DN1903_c0_g1_i1.p1 TRINITY_DN1903_c0_g1~~TRINITY_DN1903_c0_g1_i1.p1  ORF type:complete len:122 (-),score=8.39 TRINITY_DN1903_c0_g1_i1:502-867(-)
MCACMFVPACAAVLLMFVCTRALLSDVCVCVRVRVCIRALLSNVSSVRPFVCVCLCARVPVCVACRDVRVLAAACGIRGAPLAPRAQQLLPAQHVAVDMLWWPVVCALRRLGLSARHDGQL